MNFTAIDFETANYNHTSICQIGLVVVENNEVVHQFSSLIKPEPNYFLKRFTDIHGIDFEDTKEAPTFADLWKTIAPFLEGKTIVAHNASFDISVLEASLRHYNLSLTSYTKLCSCQLGRKAFPKLTNHKLSTISGYLGIPLNHHDAASDAYASAMITIHANNLLG